MMNLNIATININGARSAVKRASLFRLCELKKLDVTFVQETHSDRNTEAAWRKEWPGQLFLSHKLSTSAGVAVLFSRTFNPQNVEVRHIIDGHALVVKTLFEGKKVTFLCVYAPVSVTDRVLLLNTLDDFISGLADEFLFMGVGISTAQQMQEWTATTWSLIHHLLPDSGTWLPPMT